jgi:hypothetical protein
MRRQITTEETKQLAAFRMGISVDIGIRREKKFRSPFRMFSSIIYG